MYAAENGNGIRYKDETDAQAALSRYSKFPLVSRDQDYISGKTLVSARFGYYAYIDTEIVRSRNCPSPVPVEVQLKSLLPLLRIEAAHPNADHSILPWRLISSPLSALTSICGLDLGRSLKYRLDYIFQGNSVAEVEVTYGENTGAKIQNVRFCLLYTSPSPRDRG